MARPKIALDSINSSRTAPMAPMETTGATPTPDTSVAGVIKPSAPATSSPAPQTENHVKSAHQTHGAGVPTGPIMSVGQLLRNRSQVKGAVESFDTLEDYKSYLNTLSLSELHTHAVAQAKTIPIEDRNRLIRRLESEWSTFASRAPGNKAAHRPVQPKPFTPEQMAKGEELMKKMLRR